MDRLQSAIDKARHHREAAGVGRPDRTALVHPVSPRRETPIALTQAWETIPAFAPSARKLEQRRVMTFVPSAAATAFDMLRTRVLQQMQQNNWRRLAITSPTGGNGKTTLAANLAFGLARQQEVRTALIELDMRRPALGSTLGLERQELQFSEVLEGKVPYAAHMRRVGDNLAFGVCNRPASHSTELLRGDTAAAVLSQVEQDLNLTLMLFDMPPMLQSDDMLAFASNVDCALLVVAAESSSIEEIDQCERELGAQTKMLGVVLNKCRYADTGYGY